MSDVRPIAIAIADLHLSLTRPACRADKDWLEVQAHYLSQVTQIRKEHSGIISLPFSVQVMSLINGILLQS